MPAFLPYRAEGAACMRWLAVLLLLFNVVFGAALPSVARAQDSLRSGSAESLVVCTAAGMVILDQGDLPAGPATDHASLCVFCLPLMHGGVVPSAPSPVVAVAQPALEGLPWPEQSVPARAARLSGSLIPRAPPVFL